MSHKELRFYGPPGTGKTQRAVLTIQQAVDKFGAENVMVSSFTKTAAREIAGRDTTGVRAATLHSHCWRGLDQPHIAEACVAAPHKGADDSFVPWNRAYPQYAVSAQGKDIEEGLAEAPDASEGDELLGLMQRYRAEMLPMGAWPDARVIAFGKRWEDWKAQHGLSDFTDLIEGAITELPYAPGNPTVGVVDECFVAGTLVLCERGLVPIEQVIAGDNVFTHAGRWMPVTATMSREGATITIRGQGHPHLRCTPRQEFWTQGGWMHGEGLRGERWASPLRFPAGGAIPAIERQHRERHMPTPSPCTMAWLVGRYLADGSLSSATGAGGKTDRVYWSIGNAKADAFRERAEPSGWTFREGPAGDACTNFMVGSSALARWFERQCGRGARGKRFPVWLLGLPRAERQAALDGYVSGDGSLVGDRIKITSVNWNLIVGFRLLANSLGHVSSVYDRGAHFQLVLAFSSRYNDTDDQHIYTAVRDVSSAGSETVYDLTVAEDHSFVADGVVVHNCQDMNKLQLTLIRSWARYMSYLVMFGDDDQTIFEWAGCTPQAFLEPPIAAERETVLEQSYRVPRAVHARALRWIEQVGYRKPKAYRPRDADGRLMRSAATWRRPEGLVKDAARRVEAGETVMFLASCGYMLQPLAAALREAGLPFHNPYRPAQGAWNPLRLGARGAVTAADRLLLLRRPQDARAPRMWTYKELAALIAPLRAQGALRHGAKAEIEAKKKDPGLVGWDELAAWFHDSALEGLYSGDERWYYDNVLTARQKAFDFPLRVIAKRGHDGLLETPKVIIGSIHSVKGGEADCVYLWNDLSHKGYYEAWQSPDRAQRDAVRRWFYVAMTRARETLVLGSPSSNLYVDGL